jgi:hypothetical protein
MLVEPALYGFEYVLMLPSRNSSLFTGGATMLDDAVLADVGQIAVQNGGLMELDNLGSAESFAITASRLPGGKFLVRSGTSKIETVILADQVLELRMRGELFHCPRERKATDAYSRLEDVGRVARLAEDI